MSTFFQQTAQTMIAKHIDRFPLLKLDQVIDWQPIEQYLNRQRTFCRFDELSIPDYSTLCRYRNWLAQDDIRGYLSKISGYLKQKQPKTCV